MQQHLKKETLRIWSDLAGEIKHLFGEMWNIPELSAMEYRSSALLCDFIERSGFFVDIGVGGVPTRRFPMYWREIHNLFGMRLGSDSELSIPRHRPS